MDNALEQPDFDTMAASLRVISQNVETVSTGFALCRNLPQVAAAHTLETIVAKLDNIQADVQNVKTEVQTIKTDLQNVKTDLQNVKTDLQNVKTDLQNVKTQVQNIKTDLQNVKTEVQNVKTGVEDLKTQLGLQASATNWNACARTANSILKTSSQALVALHSPTTNMELTGCPNDLSELNDMLVTDLRTLLEALGLPSDGLRDDLRQRVKHAMGYNMTFN